MYKPIYEFAHYRDYLASVLNQGGKRSGRRLQLAKHLGVHTTFISQILNSKSELSLEQAELTNEFFKHNTQEADFFIELVLFSKAGSIKLKNRFKDRIEFKRKQSLNIRERLEPTHQISQDEENVYYSSPFYSLIYVMSSIPRFQNLEKMRALLNFEERVFGRYIEFLMKTGLILVKDGKATPGKTHIHLDNSSANMIKHHINWRLEAIRSLPTREDTDLHYSMAFSASEKQVALIREAWLHQLKETAKAIESSPEENVFVMNIDLFKY